MNFQVTEVATSNRCSMAARTTNCARDEVGNFNRISVLSGLDDIEEGAYQTAPSAIKNRVDAILATHNGMKNGESPFLFIHIAREARNHLFHGNAPMPFPLDWGPETEYRVHGDSNVMFVGYITQLILLSIQTLLYLVF